MKILYPLLFTLIFIGCSESESLDITEYYESYSTNRIVLELSSDSYIEGGKAIKFNSVALDELSRVIPNVKPNVYVNDELVTSDEYIPPTSGVFIVESRMPDLNLKSTRLEIKSIYGADLQNFELSYDALPYLTTEPWSTLGDFKLTSDIPGAGKTEFRISELLDKISNKMISTGENITTAGTYEFFTQIGTVETNAVEIEVRPKKEYPVTTIPLIFHFVSSSRLATASHLNTLIEEANSLLSQSFEAFNLENPNKVNIPIQFYLASTDPDGNALSMPGIHAVSTGNSDTSLDRLRQLQADNYWDPNHYLNVYVASGDYSELVGGEFNPSGFANFAPILGFDLPGGFNVSTDDNAPFFVGIIMNGNLGPELFIHEAGHVLNLHHNFEKSCGEIHGDYLQDTYAYNRLPGVIPQDSHCDKFPIINSNFMDYTGRVSLFTYDQAERIQRVIEHGLSIPTPRNMNKSKPLFNNKIIMPEHVHACSFQSHTIN